MYKTLNTCATTGTTSSQQQSKEGDSMQDSTELVLLLQFNNFTKAEKNKNKSNSKKDKYGTNKAILGSKLNKRKVSQEEAKHFRKY